MKIKNDEGYFKALDWLVERSVKLSNPLLGERDRKSLAASYDLVEAECLAYRMPHVLKAVEEPKKGNDLSWLD